MGNLDEQVIAGDALVAFLANEWQAGPVRIAPPPRSWAALKPYVWQFIEDRRARKLPVPRFHGYPSCAFGRDHLELDVVPHAKAFAPCVRCGVRAQCSPPSEWNDELQPYSDQGALERWTLFHHRVCKVSGRAHRPEIDALVEAHLGCGLEWTRRHPCSLEPSLQLDDALSPILRLAIFHGPQLRGEEGRRRTQLLLESYARLHAIAGQTPPPALVETLASHAPFAFPVGFEARLDTPLLLKGYVEWGDAQSEDKRSLIAALVALTGAPMPAVDVDSIGMLGIGSSEGRLVSLKMYVRRDPLLGWAEMGLPPIAAEHALMRNSGGEAYAVVDLRHPERRAAKWDFSLRRQLISGTRLTAMLAGVVSPRGAADLDQVVHHHAFRTDCVAVGLRDDRPTIYLHLS